MVIDDLLDRSHDCDVLLEQNQPGAEGANRTLTSSDAIILAGPDYAMLRPQFFLLRYKSLKKFKKNGLNEIVIIEKGSKNPQIKEKKSPNRNRKRWDCKLCASSLEERKV